MSGGVTVGVSGRTPYVRHSRAKTRSTRRELSKEGAGSHSGPLDRSEELRFLSRLSGAPIYEDSDAECRGEAECDQKHLQRQRQESHEPRGHGNHEDLERLKEEEADDPGSCQSGC